jgi:hypothetical protein
VSPAAAAPLPEPVRRQRPHRATGGPEHREGVPAVADQHRPGLGPGRWSLWAPIHQVLHYYRCHSSMLEAACSAVATRRFATPLSSSEVPAHPKRNHQTRVGGWQPRHPSDVSTTSGSPSRPRLGDGVLRRTGSRARGPHVRGGEFLDTVSGIPDYDPAADEYGLVGGIGQHENGWRMTYVCRQEGIVASLAERIG